MKKFTYVITDEIGLHARPAGMLVKKAARFSCEIIIKNCTNEKTTDAKKLFGVMGLSIKHNDPVEITFSGSDEEQAFLELQQFFEENL